MSLDKAYAHCEAAAREGARDRWLGSLFAPEAKRRHLHALIAFELEMSRMREIVREPRAGEIRLVWWREALTGERRGEALGNPVAAAMIDTLEKFLPSSHLIENAVNGRQADLYDDPFPTTGDLEAYLGETRSGLLQIAAVVLAEGRDVGAAEASGLAGVALGLIELLRGGGRPRALGPAPADLLALARRRLAEAEAERAKLPRILAPAYAGLATAPLWLKAIDRGAPDVAAWRRQWALWRWMRRA